MEGISINPHHNCASAAFVVGEGMGFKILSTPKYPISIYINYNYYSYKEATYIKKRVKILQSNILMKTENLLRMFQNPSIVEFCSVSRRY